MKDPVSQKTKSLDCDSFARSQKCYIVLCSGPDDATNVHKKGKEKKFS